MVDQRAWCFRSRFLEPVNDMYGAKCFDTLDQLAVLTTKNEISGVKSPTL